jgi:hypothetical protein
MPVARMERCESPNQTFLGKTCLHRKVFGDVIRIIKVYKVVVVHLPKDRNDCHS